MVTQMDPALEAVLPDEIPYELNEVDLERPKNTYRPTGKSELFQGVITKAFASVARNKESPEKSSNNMQLELTIRALGAGDAIAGPEIRAWVTLPISNPKVAGHKPYASGDEFDDLHKKAREFIRCILGPDALPNFAKKKEGVAGVYIDPATGVEVTEDERKALEKAVHTKTRTVLSEWYNELRKTGTCPLLKSTLYFSVYKPAKGKYNKLGYFRYDAEGREVITENFTA